MHLFLSEEPFITRNIYFSQWSCPSQISLCLYFRRNFSFYRMQRGAHRLILSIEQHLLPFLVLTELFCEVNLHSSQRSSRLMLIYRARRGSHLFIMCSSRWTLICCAPQSRSLPLILYEAAVHLMMLWRILISYDSARQILTFPAKQIFVILHRTDAYLRKPCHVFPLS